ncbi:MAG: aldehyde dehydrogenase [Halobacteriovoraceae bacterium]|nr:aldehyde dehydrogenase [Halobacteriovoraceae bacterium]MCB9094120.1 aldehyde dehydrogenase [Halobacteriovoraceae bacterium]
MTVKPLEEGSLTTSNDFDLSSIADKQREYFFTDVTQDYQFRRTQLKKLLSVISSHEKEISEAFQIDLGKSHAQFYSTELGVFYKSIKEALRNLKKWMKPKKVKDGLATFPSRSYIYSSALGSNLIIAPWNYPFLLMFDPLIGAIAAGNCAVIKPSELTPHISAITKKIIHDHFDSRFLAVVEGGVEETQTLLNQNFDHIFFTGSTQVGKIIMQAAAKHLTPVTLELGGKSPCIIHSSADLDVTARRVVWGKFLNCGQTCVAPDFVVIEESLQEAFLKKINHYLREFYGESVDKSPDYGKIVNEKHLSRLVQLAEKSGVVKHEIKNNPETRYFAPLLVPNCDWDNALMSEEIFGPILPIIPVRDIESTISRLKKMPPPLAFYFFGRDKRIAEKFISQIRFGGGCINDTIIHLASTSLPFGGVKESGIGRYHGKSSFDSFSYQKSIIKKPFWLDIPLRYPPLKNKIAWIKKVLK